MTVASPKQRGKRRVQGWISTNSPSTWPKARLQSGHRQSPWRSSAFVGSTQDSSDLVMMVKSMRHLTMSTIAPIVHPDSIPVYLQSISPMRSRTAPTTREGGAGQGIEGRTYFTVPFFCTGSEDCECKAHMSRPCSSTVHLCATSNRSTASRNAAAVRRGRDGPWAMVISQSGKSQQISK
jgi:hypothetical protein